MAKASQAVKTPRKASHPARQADSLDVVRAMPLNFKVPADFRREFKTYAAQHNKKLNQVLYEAFAALKAKHAG
jgi:hypothetical protein